MTCFWILYVRRVLGEVNQSKTPRTRVPRRTQMNPAITSLHAMLALVPSRFVQQSVCASSADTDTDANVR